MASYWVDDFDPFLIRFGGEWGIRYYGLAYVAAFVAASLMLRYLYRKGKSPLDGNAVSSVMLYLVIGVLIGGRLGYMLLYGWHIFLQNPLSILMVWQGGMSSHGGFIGVAVACYFSAKKTNLSFWKVSDLLCVVAPSGLFLGRIANFINGELWGRVSSVPWAIIFPKSAPSGTPIELIAARHPSQIYEALLEGLLLGIFAWWRFCYTNARRTSGRLTGEFLLVYGGLRILGEQFRAPDASLFFGLNRGIFYSFFMLIAGTIIMAWTGSRSADKRNATD